MIGMDRSRIFAIAAAAGVLLEERDVAGTFWYDGHSVALNLSPGRPATEAELLHEIAHHLVATDEELLFPEYGMKSRALPRLKDDDDYYQRVESARTEMGGPERGPWSQVRECAANLLNWRVAVELGIGHFVRPDMTWDSWNTSLNSFYKGRRVWEDTAREWLAEIGLDEDRTVRRLVEAGRSSQILLAA